MRCSYFEMNRKKRLKTVKTHTQPGNSAIYFLFNIQSQTAAASDKRMLASTTSVFEYEFWDFDYCLSVLLSPACSTPPGNLATATTLHRKVVAKSTSLSKGNCVCFSPLNVKDITRKGGNTSNSFKTDAEM